MNFLEYLKLNAKLIDIELEDYLINWRKEVIKISPVLLPLTEEFIKSCYGGKRIRGVLVNLGYELAGGKSKNLEIIKASSALEIFQTAILAHDDIIDQSKLRRGKPTIYQALGGNHYGIAQTISLADIGFFLSTRQISSTKFPPQIKNEAISIFSQMIINTGLGQLLDVELSRSNTQRLEKDVLMIHHLKTAYYTIIYPLLMGAIFAGGSKSLFKNIEEYGKNLGIAFQIQDDILGVFGSEKQTGKSSLSDIEESKNTLLITQAIKKATKSQSQTIQKYYGKKKITKKEAKKIRQVFMDTGSLEYSQKQAQRYVLKAKNILPNLTKDQKLLGLLNSMSEFLINRQM